MAKEEIQNPNFAKYRLAIQRMRLLDDDLMRAVFHENCESTEEVLQIIMGQKDLKVQDVVAQFDAKNLYGRSARLDVFATDSTGKKYNIEIQRSDEGAGKKRARYNQSIIDTNCLSAGVKPNLLPDVHVIFITEHDVCGSGLPIYHVERVIQETGALFDDGEHIIYVNGAYDSQDTELGVLIADFRETDPNKVQTKSLAKRMKYFKENEKGVAHMCRIMEEIKDEGYDLGAQGAAIVVKTYTETKSVFEAAAKASITIERARKILALFGIDAEYSS